MRDCSFARHALDLHIFALPIPDSDRGAIIAHTAPVPMVLEIPSKDVAYDSAKDPIMKRVLMMLGEAP